VIRDLTRVALAVLVVVGWLFALLWFSASVIQIAVDHSTAVTVVGAHCPSAGDAPCRH
jgi:hypothetical protein